MSEFYLTRMGRTFYDSTMPRIADALEMIAARLTEQAALRNWTYATCGARFPHHVPPNFLEGVDRCAACVATQYWRERAEAAEKGGIG